MVLYRRIGFVTATAVLTGYAAVTLLGPQRFLRLRERLPGRYRRVERENA